MGIQAEERAYGVEAYQITLPGNLDQQRYDVELRMARGQKAGLQLLQRIIEESLGLSVRREQRELDGFTLRVPAHGTTKLVKSADNQETHSGWGTDADGQVNFTLTSERVPTLCQALRRFLECPVLDETKLADRFDVLLIWKDGDGKALQAAVRDQLGLELHPSRQKVEVLIFEQKTHEKAGD